MFTINHSSENNKEYVILQNKAKTSKAKICLEEGARIVELTFDGNTIIKEQPNFNYKTSYASSILFPFASRIKNGAYSFLGVKYQLEKNDDGKNALHGLVYNKKFELFEPEEHADNCSATFNYYEKNESIGFPFFYYISVTYTLYKKNLSVRITVKNIDEKPFPFILGWHPYFISSDLQNSFLHFNSNKKVVYDQNLVTKEIVDHQQENPTYLKDKQLDDCFFLKDNEVSFSTPDYNIKLTSSEKENFLQLYTPKDKPIIAIEPMTGISNSFNNKIGIQVLEPNDSYSINWKLEYNPLN